MMGMEFKLSPHTKSILCGRGMCDCEEIDGKKYCRLLCAANNCLFHPKDSPDPKFGRDIEVKGYIICSRCGARTEYLEGLEWNDKLRKKMVRCKACSKAVSENKVEWTQKVISRHRRSRHEYFHKECWVAMFIDVTDEEIASFCGYSDNYKIMRLIKWAMKV